MMAKLEGVKTLDMVNGEITKVAYGGAEYAKTDSPVQEGDLFLLTEGHTIISGESGEFYLTEKYRNGAIVIPTRYFGNATATQSDGDGIAFRKVAATTPSVEERVAKAEGEIESLKSEVATLKGADEPKPERLKVGDYAKVVEDQTTSDDDPIGDEACVGDYVEVLTVDKSDIPFEVRIITGKKVGDTAWAREFALVRATDEEVAEAKRAAEFAKFKEGAKVRLLSGGGEYPLNGFENGKIYEVEDEGYPHIAGEYVRIIGGDAFQGFATPDQLEILSEEEAAERKKWAEIEREVGEYKVGDIFRSPGGNLFEINRIDDRSPYPIRFTNLKGDDDGYKRDAAITLITPVEARFDR